MFARVCNDYGVALFDLDKLNMFSWDAARVMLLDLDESNMFACVRNGAGRFSYKKAIGPE